MPSWLSRSWFVAQTSHSGRVELPLPLGGYPVIVSLPFFCNPFGPHPRRPPLLALPSMPPRPCPQVPVDKPVERVREHVEVREVKVPVDRVIERVVVPRARWKSKVGAGGRGGGQTGPLSASVEGTKIRVKIHAMH